MHEVNISELKNRLSHYLRIVRRGESVLVLDRRRVIARIEPVRDPASLSGDDDRRAAGLERRGILRRARGRLTRAWLERAPRIEADAVQELLGERREGR